ncbi:MAG: Holliday junction resolvase RuvX [Thermoguttaceae bacterium]
MTETQSGRVAGIDYGTVRIGIAISDQDRRLSSPYEMVIRTTERREADYFRRLVNEERITRFAVGLPLHISGDLSEKAQEVLRFGKWLHETTGIDVHYVDERYTSVEAEYLLKEAKLTHKQRKARRDKVAAQILLAMYLESGCRGLEEYRSLDDEK